MVQILQFFNEVITLMKKTFWGVILVRYGYYKIARFPVSPNFKEYLFNIFINWQPIAQLLERLSCKQKTWVQVPARPILFEQGGLANPYNPATLMLRSRSRRMFELLADFVQSAIPVKS